MLRINNFKQLTVGNLYVCVSVFFFFVHACVCEDAEPTVLLFLVSFRKSMQRNKQMAIGRKKFNMDPKKVAMKTTLQLSVSCGV